MNLDLIEELFAQRVAGVTIKKCSFGIAQPYRIINVSIDFTRDYSNLSSSEIENIENTITKHNFTIEHKEYYTSYLYYKGYFKNTLNSES